MTSRINKVAFKIKGGPTQLKNFSGIESNYDPDKGLSHANKKEIRKIVAEEYDCTESDVMFSDEFEKARKEAEKKAEKESDEKESDENKGGGGNS